VTCEVGNPYYLLLLKPSARIISVYFF